MAKFTVRNTIHGNRLQQRIFARSRGAYAPRSVASSPRPISPRPLHIAVLFARRKPPPQPAPECLCISPEPARIDHHVVTRPDDVFLFWRPKLPRDRQPATIFFDDLVCVIGMLSLTTSSQPRSPDTRIAANEFTVRRKDSARFGGAKLRRL
jgi:hypothetical protein